MLLLFYWHRKCSNKDVADIYKNFYNRDLDMDLDAEEEMMDGFWSPAEVMQIFLNNIHQPERGLEKGRKKALS